MHLSRDKKEFFSAVDPCLSNLYLAIYRAPSVIPLQCPFHRLHRNWINLKITRKDDRPVANAGNSPTFRPSYRVMRLGLTFARYRILYKVGPNIPSPFTNECRFLSNGRFFCIWFIWDFRDVTCSTLQLCWTRIETHEISRWIDFSFSFFQNKILCSIIWENVAIHVKF